MKEARTSFLVSGGALDRLAADPKSEPLASEGAGSTTTKSDEDRDVPGGEGRRQAEIRGCARAHSPTGPLKVTIRDPILKVSSPSPSIIQVPSKAVAAPCRSLLRGGLWSPRNNPMERPRPQVNQSPSSTDGAHNQPSSKPRNKGR